MQKMVKAMCASSQAHEKVSVTGGAHWKHELQRPSLCGSEMNPETLHPDQTLGAQAHVFQGIRFEKRCPVPLLQPRLQSSPPWPLTVISVMASALTHDTAPWTRLRHLIVPHALQTPSDGATVTPVV